jgi:uncharacterized PurR-regulated membrane protein YhhQ (DUF165 family)
VDHQQYAQQGVPDMQAAFTAIFGQGMNIILGSLTAFVVGQLVDAFVFRRIKRITGDQADLAACHGQHSWSAS